MLSLAEVTPPEAPAVAHPVRAALAHIALGVVLGRVVLMPLAKRAMGCRCVCERKGRR